MKSPSEFAQPPRVAVWFLNLFALEEEGESILGDLLEEFSLLVSKSGIASARRWYWRQTVKTLPQLAGVGTEEGLGKARLQHREEDDDDHQQRRHLVPPAVIAGGSGVLVVGEVLAPAGVEVMDEGEADHEAELHLPPAGMPPVALPGEQPGRRSRRPTSPGS